MKTLALILVILIGLSACGGGGGDSGAAVSVTSFPVLQAIQNATTNGLQSTLNVTGTFTTSNAVYPVTGSLIFTENPAVNTTFNGAAAYSVLETESGSLIANGQTAPLNTSATTYLTTTYQPTALVSASEYCVATTLGSYPTTAIAGQTGTLANYSCYTNNLMTTPLETIFKTYSTTAGNTPNTLNIEISTNSYNTSNQLTSVGFTTYAITSVGTAILISVGATISANGSIISFTAQ